MSQLVLVTTSDLNAAVAAANADLSNRTTALETTVNTTATSAPTANALAKRDASGRLQVANPSVDADALNRGAGNALYLPVGLRGAVNGLAATDASGRVLTSGDEITGVAAPATNPAAGKVWTYLDSADGQLRWRNAAGTVRRPTSDWGSGTTLPASGMLRGDVYYHTGVGCLWIYTGTAWKQGETCVVADATTRLSISTNYASLLPLGFAVAQTDTKVTWTWNGTDWDGGWLAYTPVWSAANGSVSLGNGSLTGRYRKIGKNVEFYLGLSIGSTSNGAAGNFAFTLPFTASALLGEQHSLVKGYVPGLGANITGFGLITASATTVTPFGPNSLTNSNMQPIRNADSSGAAGTGWPTVSGTWPFSSGSNLYITGRYEMA